MELGPPEGWCLLEILDGTWERPPLVEEVDECEPLQHGATPRESPFVVVERRIPRRCVLIASGPVRCESHDDGRRPLHLFWEDVPNRLRFVRWQRERGPLRREVTVDHDGGLVDLTDAAIARLTIRAEGLTELRLPACLEGLHLIGIPEAPVVVRAERAGAHVKVLAYGRRSPLRGVPRLGALALNIVPEDRVDGPFEVAAIARAHPHLGRLRLFGDRSHVADFDRLADLPNLIDLHVSECFGFTADDVPEPSDLPRLDDIWLHSIPADAMRRFKRQWGERARMHTRAGRSASWREAHGV